MYAEITKVKKLTIAQYNNDVQLYFDAVQFLKLQIDQKDLNAYTEDAYICDIFLQLKHDLSLWNSDSNLVVKKLVG
jgi:hypothetical protein